MNADFQAGALCVLAAALFALAAAAASALTLDLGEIREGEPVPVAVSRAETNRIEFPETIINAFSSSGGMDVRITGRSALVRTEDPAELIVLTEKRRVTLLLSPEEVPSRTVIMRDGEAPSPGPGGEAAGAQALPYERAITELVLSLASRRIGMEKSPGEEREISPSLLLARRARAASPPFFASLYTVRNSGSETASLTESMFSVGPETVAVGMERDRLSPGESSRVFVVTREEPGR